MTPTVGTYIFARRIGATPSTITRWALELQGLEPAHTRGRPTCDREIRLTPTDQRVLTAWHHLAQIPPGKPPGHRHGDRRYLDIIASRAFAATYRNPHRHHPRPRRNHPHQRTRHPTQRRRRRHHHRRAHDRAHANRAPQPPRPTPRERPAPDMTTPAPLAERRTNALDGLTHITGHTDHYCRPLTSSPGWSCSARPRSSRPYAEPSRRRHTAMHDHSDPWAPFALLFAAVLFAGAGIDWHAVAEAAHTAAAYGLALFVIVALCGVVAVTARRARAPRWAQEPREPIIGQPAYWGVTA